MKKIVKKELFIVAGPNGSGKTTFAKIALARDKSNSIFLNPDLIASGLSPLQTNQTSFQAGRVLLSEIKERISRGENFGFESTLSGKTYLSLVGYAKEQGYLVTIYFIHLKSISLSLKRIQKRVSEGGHDIPRSAVVRRNSRCFLNFWHLYRPLADEWFVFNNSNRSPLLTLTKDEYERSNQKKQLELKFLKGK